MREGGVIPKDKGACRFHMRGIYYLKCEVTVVPPHVSLILVVLLHVWIISEIRGIFGSYF